MHSGQQSAALQQGSGWVAWRGAVFVNPPASVTSATTAEARIPATDHPRNDFERMVNLQNG